MTLVAVRTPVVEAIRRHPMLAVLIVVLVALCAFALLWHLVAMNHDYPNGMLGGCVVVLAIVLAVVVPHFSAVALGAATSSPVSQPTGSAPPDPGPRPPPQRGSIQATVLLR